MEFLKVDSVETAREKLHSNAKCLISQESLPAGKAPGRILAADVFAPDDIPSFTRSTVDGFAVVAADTAAAGESIPVMLAYKGSVEMGHAASFSIGRGECAEVATGGMLPEGADAVAMIEYAEPFGDSGVALYTCVSYGDNVVRAGEDINAGCPVLTRGRLLLPHDIGALAAAGVTEVEVYKPLRLTIISTGDELVHPGHKPEPGQVRDVNTSALAALAEKDGYAVIGADVLKDDAEALERALTAAMEISDVVVVSGGSSQGKKDMTRTVIDRVSSPGVCTHGMAIKPGKPTIIGYDEKTRTLLAGLPGHPVSAMIVFETLFGRLYRELTGTPEPLAVPAKLSCNAASSPGRLTCQPASLRWDGSGYIAEPVFGKSGLITTLTRADGYFAMDRNSEGMQAGQIVLVHLF